MDEAVAFERTDASDAESLVALRIAAMRESLERIGRFDAQRARDRFLAGFAPACTWHVVVAGQRVGFLALREPGDGVDADADAALLLDHLYVDPRHQGRGIGGAVLARVCVLADAARRPLKLCALRESDANRFYARHGFVQVEQAEWDNHYRRPPADAAGAPVPLDASMRDAFARGTA